MFPRVSLFLSPRLVALFLLGVGSLGARSTAFARLPQENFVEMQALRFSLGTVKLEDTKAAGGTDKATLKDNGLATFPNRVNFVGHYDKYALQLTHDFSQPGSGYLSFGYVVSDFIEVGVGANLGWSDQESVDSKNQKTRTKRTELAMGPYVLANLPTGIGELEVRWELDYGMRKAELKRGNIAAKAADATGFESDLDARFVFRMSQRVSFTSGANIFYKSMTDKAPSIATYSKSKRTDFVLGLNLLGARFSF